MAPKDKGVVNVQRKAIANEYLITCLLKTVNLPL